MIRPIGQGANRGRAADGSGRKNARSGITVAAAVVVAVMTGDCSPAPFVGFRTDDGFRIAASLSRPLGDRAAPLVVAGHQLERDRHSWDPLVPALTRLGFAVLTLDHRGFGESTDRAASPAELSEIDRRQMYLDFTGAIDAVRDDPRVDSSRVVLMASGVSVASAVRCAEERRAVRAIVLFPGLIEQGGRDFLLAQPDLPLLLLAAGGETRGRDLVRQYAGRFTGPAQEHVEFPSSEHDPADWIGTDGLRADPGVAEMIVWFLERHVTPSSPE